MKELTIEQKSQRYDEAFEKAKNYHKQLLDEDNPEWAHEIEKIFPELKESEDERIRKQLLNWFKDCKWDAIDNETLKRDDIIAWLEAQGEHANFRNNIQIGDKVTRNEAGILVNISQLNRVAKKRGEQKSTLPKWKYKNDNTPLLRDSIILNKYGCVAKSPSGALVSDVWVMDYAELAKLPKEEIEKQGEQNPAWSEEDEIGLGDALWAIQQARTIAKDENDMGNIWYAENWLKSLKDRIQPQPKQEWSEEDEAMINKLLAVVNLYYDRSGNDLDKQSCISFLKSLRPQSHWKPSDEQMNNK